MFKKILALHTGGTISMAADDSGAVITNEVNPMTQVTSPIEGIEVTSEDIFNLPSPQMTPHHMLALYQRIKEAAQPLSMGSSLHTEQIRWKKRLISWIPWSYQKIAVVITGAMRSSNELGSDGVYNFLTALRVAADPKARDKGVLVVMNDEIHAAKYVTKTHTTNVSTFQTPTHGPLGLVMKKEILFFKTAEPRVRFDLDTIDGFVPIIATYAGMKTDLLDMLDLSKLDGLIIASLWSWKHPERNGT